MLFKAPGLNSKGPAACTNLRSPTGLGEPLPGVCSLQKKPGLIPSVPQFNGSLSPGKQ